MSINKWLWPLYSRIYDMLLDMPLYRALLNEVIEALSLRDTAMLLDAGCGTGNLERQVSALNLDGLRVTAIDRSPEMLRIALAKNPKGISFQQADLDKGLPFAVDHFDRIALIHVLYALSNPISTLEELYRLLRSKGRIVIVNPRRHASVKRVVLGNLHLLKPIERPFFLARMSLVILLNTLITSAGQRGHFHFWEIQKHEEALRSTGYSVVSIRATYADQSYLIIAEKE